MKAMPGEMVAASSGVNAMGLKRRTTLTPVPHDPMPTVYSASTTPQVPNNSGGMAPAAQRRAGRRMER